MSNKTVLIDIDDTLADTQTHILQYVNSNAKRHYKREEISRSFREGKSSEYTLLVKQFLNNADLVAQILPYSDALGAMQKLHQNNYAIHIVSARKQNLYDTTLAWLNQHGFADFIHHVHPRPNLSRGHVFKARVARDINPVAAFEDTYDVALALAREVPCVYLIDKPWNLAESIPANIVRASSFNDSVEDFLSSTPSSTPTKHKPKPRRL